MSEVKDVAKLIQMEQRMKADPAYAERLYAEARRNKETKVTTHSLLRLV